MHHLLIAVVIIAMTSAAFAQSEAEKLHQLFDQRESWLREQFPAMAMSKGDYSHADRLADMSLATIEKRFETTKSHLERLHAIQRQAVSGEDQVNYDLFELELSNAVEGHRF